jgi:hypothetical protein
MLKALRARKGWRYHHDRELCDAKLDLKQFDREQVNATPDRPFSPPSVACRRIRGTQRGASAPHPCKSGVPLPLTSM